jgi:uncharacterized protein YciI
MEILLIEYTVADYDAWRAVFDRDPMGRASYGVTRHRVYRDADDPTHVLLRLECRTVEDANAFRAALQPVWDVSGAGRAWVLDEADPDAPRQTGRHLDQPADPHPAKDNFFLYKLIPPRPTFAVDATPAEAAVMARHAGYWQQLTEAGTAVVFGPVADPAGAWGLAVVTAQGEGDVEALGAADPAVTSGLATFEVHPMPGATAGP